MVQKIKQKFSIGFTSLSLLFFPIFAFAQDTYFDVGGGGSEGTPQDLKGFVGIILGLIKLAIPVLIALSLVVFLWGMAMFILNAGDTTKRSEGKKFMIWGVITLFVMFSVWGIVQILVNSFGIPFGIPLLRIS